MTELDFLLEILLSHKLQKATQTAIKERIKVIQGPGVPARMMIPPQTQPVALPPQGPIQTPEGKPLAPQSPSTLALLEKHGLAVPAAPVTHTAPVPPIVPMTAQQRLQAAEQRIDRDTGTVMIPTGNGTFGKKKF